MSKNKWQQTNSDEEEVATASAAQPAATAFDPVLVGSLWIAAHLHTTGMAASAVPQMAVERAAAVVRRYHELKSDGFI